MGAMPQKMILGAAAGFVGAILALAVMAYAWDGTTDSVYKLGLDMLVALSFFAAAGTFMKYSPVQGNTMAVLSGLTIAFTVIATIYGAFEVWQTIVLLILGAVCLLCAACPTVTSWVDANRKV